MEQTPLLVWCHSIFKARRRPCTSTFFKCLIWHFWQMNLRIQWPAAVSGSEFTPSTRKIACRSCQQCRSVLFPDHLTLIPCTQSQQKLQQSGLQKAEATRHIGLINFKLHLWRCTRARLKASDGFAAERPAGMDNSQETADRFGHAICGAFSRNWVTWRRTD